MEMLGDARISLRVFLLKAAALSETDGARALQAACEDPPDRDLKRLLHQTVVAQYYPHALPYPRAPWSTARSLSLGELLALVIEKLLVRKHADPSDSNLLTLGYREVTPGTNGHRVAATNSVMCYYPNTLVATLKQPAWELLHEQIGDDLLVHLLLNYCIFIKTPAPSGSFVQLAGKSLRWIKQPASAVTAASKKRKRPATTESTSTGGRHQHQHHHETVTINQIMYARHFQKRKIFAKSDLGVVLAAVKCGNEVVTRGKASQLVRTIFPESQQQQHNQRQEKRRLPKRLIQLVPATQELLRRLQSFNPNAFIAKMLPVPKEMAKFLHEDHRIKDVLSASRAARSSGGQQVLDALVCKVADDGYLSQEDVDDDDDEPPSSGNSNNGNNNSDNRKRKRRECAIQSLSTVSELAIASSSASRAKKRVRFHHNVAAAATSSGSATASGPHHHPLLPVPVSPPPLLLGVNQLAHLQRHRHEIATLLQFATPKGRVQRIVRKLVATIVPKSVWGCSTQKEKPAASSSSSSSSSLTRSKTKSKSNWHHVKAFLDRLILSNKYDIVSIRHAAAAFHVKNIEWMDASGKSQCPPNERTKRHAMVTQLLHWITQNIVFPVLRNAFYITESESSANHVFFYPRAVWSLVTTLAMYDLTSCILKPQPMTSDATLVRRQLAASRLRLLPKIHHGVRPLMNLSGKPNHSDVSVNKSLELVHKALLFEMERQASKFQGSTVRTVDEIAKKLKTLFCDVQQCSHCVTSGTSASGSGRHSKLFCVSVDVERCFDTIRPKKLLSILKKVFLEDEYLVRKHWVCKRSNYKMERPACPSGELQSFDDLVQKQRAATNKKTTKQDSSVVFVDGVLYDYVTKKTILSLLKEHLTRNAVVANGQLYQQQQGIPQGSVLSTTLCNLYYAHFEKRVLHKQLATSTSSTSDNGHCCHELLMRYTDDFFFVSTNQEKAKQFAQFLHKGNEEYGCFVNFRKSRVNFHVLVPQKGDDGQCVVVPRFDCRPPQSGEHATTTITSTNPVVAWCGLLIDPVARQVYVNYDKLSFSSIAASIPMDDTKQIGAVFVGKVLAAIRQRWHRVFFEPACQSPRTIQINVYQMLCLAAVRFVVLVDKLASCQPRAMSTTFLHGCVNKILAKSSYGIQRTLGDDDCSGKSARQFHAVWSQQVQSIGMRSFIVVITGTKLTGGSAGTCATWKTQPGWRRLVERLAQDAKHLAASLSSLSSSTTERLNLDEVQADPHNAVVARWLESYRAVASKNRNTAKPQ